MKDYYYIKFKPLKYEDEPYYLCNGDNIRREPHSIKVFEDLDSVIDYKSDKLSDEAYQATYLFEYYEMSIERF